MPAEPGRTGRPHHETRTTAPQPRQRVSLRVSPETAERVEQIRELREGLTATRVYENAVERYHRALFGRRSADLVPPRGRRGGRPRAIGPGS